MNIGASGTFFTISTEVSSLVSNNYDHVSFRSIDGNSLDIEFRFAPFQIDPDTVGGWTVNVEM